MYNVMNSMNDDMLNRTKDLLQVLRINERCLPLNTACFDHDAHFRTFTSKLSRCALKPEDMCSYIILISQHTGANVSFKFNAMITKNGPMHWYYDINVRELHKRPNLKDYTIIMVDDYDI